MATSISLSAVAIRILGSRPKRNLPPFCDGLRYGVAAVTAGIPLNLVRKWLGRAQLSTTAIYANAVGAAEKDIAQRMWG